MPADNLDADEIDPIEEAGRVRTKRRRALRWMGAGVGVMVAGGFVTILRRHWVGNGGELPAILRAGAPTLFIGALLLVWGIVEWVRVK